MLVLTALAVASQATLYFYEGFDYAAGTPLNKSSTVVGNITNWTAGTTQPLATNRASSLTYTGLASTGGKVGLAGYRISNAAPSTRTIWDGTSGGLNGTNLFASFLLNVQSVGICQSNSTSGNYVFSLRSSAKDCLVISNNVNNSLNFNIGIQGSSGGAIGWDTGAGGNGYAPGSTLFIVMSYTNSAINGTGTWGNQLWVNPVLGSQNPGLASASIAAVGTTAYAYEYVLIGDGNGQGDPAKRSEIYLDELRVGSTWGDVVIPEPATVGMLGLGALVTMLFRRIRRR